MDGYQTMSIIEGLALAIVVLSGLYFIVLGVMSLLSPDRANRFLLGFANSAPVHYTELLLRFMIGGALVLYAPSMLFSFAFNLFGWVLVMTTAGLCLIPWQWHQRFAQKAVPRATRYISLIGVASLTIGGLILVAIVRGSAS
jgi:hypothetical protein